MNGWVAVTSYIYILSKHYCCCSRVFAYSCFGVTALAYANAASIERYSIKSASVILHF